MKKKNIIEYGGYYGSSHVIRYPRLNTIIDDIDEWRIKTIPHLKTSKFSFHLCDQCIDYDTYIQWLKRGYLGSIHTGNISMTVPIGIYKIEYSVRKANKILQDHEPFKGFTFCKLLISKIAEQYEEVIYKKHGISSLTFSTTPTNVHKQLHRIENLRRILDQGSTVFNQVLIDNNITVPQYEDVCKVLNKRLVLNKIKKF